MRSVITLLAVLCGVLLLGRAGEAMEEIVLYGCPRFATQPVISGKADDALWKTAPMAMLSYKFGAMDPTPADNRNEFKAAFDDTAFYLTCTFYREDNTPLRVNHMGRDDPDLWMDDSTEIYIDPANDGQFFKFIVNSAGVVTDLRMTSAGMDYSWDAIHAKILTTVTDKAWSLEMSVPWTDFGQHPALGAMWGFEVLRFTGKHWASWTVGGGWAHPEKFGYLCFGGGGFLNELQKLLQTVRKSKGDQWQVITPAGIMQFAAPTPALDAALAQSTQWITEARFDVMVLTNEKKRKELLAKVTPLQAVLEEARKASASSPDTSRVQALLTKLRVAGTTAREIEYDARIAQALVP